MNAILHIGTEKTGTTTLQAFLYHNAKLFEKNGILIPTSTGKNNARLLSLTAYNISRRDDFTRTLDIQTDDQLRNIQDKILRSLKKELNAQRMSFVIFSSEHFHSRLTTVQEIERLKQNLLSLGFYNFQIVLYLRDPVELASSLLSTAVRSGSTLKEAPKPKQPYWRNICHHKDTIEKWIGVFGKEALIIRIYDDSSLHNNSIIHDFLKAVNIEFEDSFVIPSNKNEGLSILAIELLRRVNEKIPYFINNQPNLIRGDIYNYFERFCPGPKYIMSPTLSKEYQEFYEESNEWVRKNFFPERKELFQRKSKSSQSINIGNQELDMVADLLVAFWNRKG